MSREHLYAIVKADHTPESYVALYTKPQALLALQTSAMRMGADTLNPLDGAGVYRVLVKVEAPQPEQTKDAPEADITPETGEALPAGAALALAFTGAAAALAVGIKTKSPAKALAVLATFGAAAIGLGYMDKVLTAEYATAPAQAPEAEAAPAPKAPDADVISENGFTKVRVSWLHQSGNATRSGDAIDMMKRWQREEAKTNKPKPGQP